nr:MAG TPA: hypothetical protein [Caudoviricetes sp.]
MSYNLERSIIINQCTGGVCRSCTCVCRLHTCSARPCCSRSRSRFLCC